jgi:hypothetical protein
MMGYFTTLSFARRLAGDPCGGLSKVTPATLSSHQAAARLGPLELFVRLISAADREKCNIKADRAD